jgi:purine-binding chemotaxis protein CheW
MAATDSAIGFIKESLEALRHFAVSTVNENWLHKRFAEWSTGRTGDDLQLKSPADADDFLSGFASPHTDELWDDEYASSVKNVLPDNTSSSINVWDLGCGKGFESYSIACILKNKYPNARLKIWANDSDIMAISSAPNMTFTIEEVPEYCRAYMVQGKNGYSFNQEIKDAVVFEYHDVVTENPMPDLEIIVARDILSYLAPADQSKVIDGFGEKLKNRGVIFMGRNEELSGTAWHRMSDDPVSAYMYSE